MFKIMLESYIKGELSNTPVAIATGMTEKEAQERLNELKSNVKNSVPSSIDSIKEETNKFAVIFKEIYLGEKHYSIQVM